MIKLIQVEARTEPKLILMNEMRPLEIAQIRGNSQYKDMYVMRTANESNFEVINLSTPGRNRCWNDSNNLPVQLLPPNQSITIELRNEED